MEITSEVVDKIAKACHEANRAYCNAMGDSSQVPWEEAPEEIKRSAVMGVMAHMMNPELTPEQSHNHWMEVRKVNGWTYGTVKDLEKKTHPCMVPYEMLPREQKAKDYLFASVVKQSRELLGV